MSRVEFTRKALDELSDAAAWYRQRNAALEQRFLAAAQETTDGIAANPLGHQIVVGRVRRARFPRRWPWSLFYVVNDAETVPGYEISQSWGIVVPAGISGQIAKRLNSEVAKVMKSSEVSDRVLNTGAVPAGDSSSDFAADTTRERRRLGELIDKTRIVLTE